MQSKLRSHCQRQRRVTINGKPSHLCTRLWDSQTLVIGQMVADTKSDGKMLRLVFVTPTIIDPAGNRVHTDEELSEKYKQAP